MSRRDEVLLAAGTDVSLGLVAPLVAASGLSAGGLLHNAPGAAQGIYDCRDFDEVRLRYRIVSITGGASFLLVLEADHELVFSATPDVPGYAADQSMQRRYEQTDGARFFDGPGQVAIFSAGTGPLSPAANMTSRIDMAADLSPQNSGGGAGVQAIKTISLHPGLMRARRYFGTPPSALSAVWQLTGLRRR